MYFVVEGHFINSAPAIPSVNDYTGTHYKVWVGKSKKCVCLIVATVAVCLRERRIDMPILATCQLGTLATVFARSDTAAATIYFIMQFCSASIREQLLIQGGVH